MILVAPALAVPNLLVIVVDDLGVDKVDSYADDFAGYRPSAALIPDTQTIDELAAAGIRFTQAYGTPLCSPTRAALLTGRMGWRTGVTDTVPEGPELDVDTETTLADVLAAGGYATGAFGKWHLGIESDPADTGWDSPIPHGATLDVGATAHPLRAGFSTYEGAIGGTVEGYYDWLGTTAAGPGSSTLTWSSEWVTDATSAAAVDWIAATAEPWFAYVAFNAPHTPGDAGDYALSDFPSDCHAVPCLIDGTCTENGRGLYMGLAECLDDRIGTMLEALDPGVLENTLIVVVGDNGSAAAVMEAQFDDQGARSENGKGTIYETGTRVPLVVTEGGAWAAWHDCSAAERMGGTCPMSETWLLSPGRTLDAYVHVADLYATLIEAAGLTPTAGEDSLSLAGCLTDAAADCGGSATSATRVLYNEVMRVDEAGALSDSAASLRYGDHKLVVRYEPDLGCARQELYHLASDPFERRSLRFLAERKFRALRGRLTGLGIPWLAGVRECATRGG